MFDSLINRGLLYGAEIYGWSAPEKRANRKYLKWTLGLKPSTKSAIRP